MSKELALQGLLAVAQQATAAAAHSKANRNKPGNGKVGAVGFALDSRGMPILTYASYNQRTENGPLEHPGGEITVPDVVHAEMSVLLSGHGKFKYMMCTESPCMGCAVHMEAAGILGVFWLQPYRITDGVDFLRSRGYVSVELEVQGTTIYGALANVEEVNDYRRMITAR